MNWFVPLMLVLTFKISKLRYWDSNIRLTRSIIMGGIILHININSIE